MQNRVNPFGQIIETTERGLWMGNRGNIHNINREIVRPFKLKAWITCRLQFKGRRREIMAPNLYTELFFLDEATAFAAGHRPCCECRREDYNKFKAAWLKGNPEYKFTGKTSIREIDAILHQERNGENGSKKTYKENNNNLPNGIFIAAENQPYLLWNKHLYLWTPAGYTKSKSLSHNGNSIILTPKSIVQTFRAGYMPQVKLT
jgi:hypothetical protein